MEENYHPEKYWTEVGEKIESRTDEKNVIAGDDEPYYRYKRERFLELLNEIDFQGKTVLEVGPGPGGNLIEVLKKQPRKLTGADISSQMIKVATKNVNNKDVEIVKTNGTTLPFPDNHFDIVFTATVLQHNTDEKMLKNLIKEICRVSGDRIFIFEKIESTVKGDELCYGRPISYYAALFEQGGFSLKSHDFLNIRSSYYVSGAIRKGLNPKTRKEGEPLNAVSVALQNVTLPVTKQLDKLFKASTGVARLEFEKK